MKRTLTTYLIVHSVLTVMVPKAQDSKPIGNDHFALKSGYIYFTDKTFDAGNGGLYLGLEGYAGVTPSIYIGAEFGASGNLTVFSGNDITYNPFEISAKYVSSLSDYLAWDFGAGLAYGRVEFKGKQASSSAEEHIVDWMFGGQMFSDIYCVLDWFTFGANLKYQMTQDFEDASWNAGNFRGGVQVGIVF